MTDRERLELAEVFARVLDTRMKSLYKELVAMTVEILNQFANDMAKAMEGENSRAMERFQQMRAQKEREVYEVISKEQKEADRAGELMAQGLSAFAGSTESSGGT